MTIRDLVKKIKLGRLKKVRMAPRWADIKKFGMKRARTRRITVDKIKGWRRTRKKV
jgi:hypothetical protein